MELVISKSRSTSPKTVNISSNDHNNYNNICSACTELLEAVILEDFHDKLVWQFTKKSWERYYFKKHYHYLGALRESSRHCDMCDLIIDHWEQGEDEDDDTEYWIFAEPILSGATACPLSFLINVHFEENNEDGQKFELFHRRGLHISGIQETERDGADLPSSPSLVRVFGSRKYSRLRTEVSVFSGSDECFALISKWMTECNKAHVECIRRENEHHTPKRLLDVASGPLKDGIRLCESVVTSEPFVALSHCWGGKVAFRTKLANKASHLCGISLYDLPNTFHDAVVIVRKLGFRYLWIDALCIIQDSAEDWLQEASTMDKVYSSAVLTISCASSDNSWAGIFAQRKRQRSIPVRLPGVQIRDLHVCALEVPEDAYIDLEHSTLNSRAWILQERILSRANLHFTDQALVWECRTGTRTEDGHSSSCHPLFKNIANYRTPTAEDTFKLWYILVEDYTRRELTYDPDKLAAISGLAAYFSGLCKIGGSYFNGMWETDLPRGLLWGKSIGSLEPLDNDVASWSWASRKGYVSYHMGLFNEGPFSIPEFDLQLHHVRKDQVEVEGLLLQTSCEAYNQSGPKRGFGHDLKFWMDDAGFTGRCHCLYVSTWGLSMAKLQAEFLVLEEVSYSERLYKRIGTASHALKKGGLVQLERDLKRSVKNPQRIRLILV